VQMMRARAAEDVKAGKAPGPEGSVQKLRAAAVFRQRAELIKDAQGLDGLLSTTPGNVEFLTAPSMSIRGGTDEIQRTIIGERVLGLEAEPRVDRDCPWSQTRSGS
jgi:alkylation response protein AidB-like acyl-CoA dehydrogenase